jgi:hypothetical protein
LLGGLIIRDSLTGATVGFESEYLGVEASLGDKCVQLAQVTFQNNIKDVLNHQVYVLD